jgi:hypothetical protein
MGKTNPHGNATPDRREKPNPKIPTKAKPAKTTPKYERCPAYFTGTLGLDGNPTSPDEAKSTSIQKCDKLVSWGTDTGEMLIKAVNKSDPEKPAFAGPFWDLLRNEGTIRKKIGMNHIYDLRHPMDANMSWRKSMHKKDGTAFTLYWPVGIHTTRDPSTNTLENRRKWTMSILKALNKVAKSKFRFPSEFQYGGDITPTNSGSNYLGNYLTTEDTMKVMEGIYQKMTREEICAASELLEQYYGPLRVNYVKQWFGYADDTIPSPDSKPHSPDKDHNNSQMDIRDMFDDLSDFENT